MVELFKKKKKNIHLGMAAQHGCILIPNLFLVFSFRNQGSYYTWPVLYTGKYSSDIIEREVYVKLAK